MAGKVDAATLRSWLSDGVEIALLDVREHGQFGEGHPFFAVPLPYSRFELGLPALVPNPHVRIALCDDGDGIAERSAARAEALGYRNAHVLTGGVAAWQAAGYTLFAGVIVPSKTFGELVELQRHTPRMNAEALRDMRAAGDNLVVVDGRPFSEYSKMNIPGGICCPNGELALHIHGIAPDPKTKIVVNCAGRTRSIIGAQTLIDLGIPNPVYALENGTQGWFLAGLALERGAQRRYREEVRSDPGPARARARALAAKHGVEFLDAGTANGWLADQARTTYLLDVRSGEEFANNPVPGFVHAPGGQLIQATDQWVGVRGARLALLDDEGVRAPVVASWLRQLGHEAYVIEGGATAAAGLAWRCPTTAPKFAEPSAISAKEAAGALQRGACNIVDVRPSMSYRQGHIAGARWSIRPRLRQLVHDGKHPVVLVADDPGIAALAACDLAEAGCSSVHLLSGGSQDWSDAGLSVVATPDKPTDAECIDFLFFTAKRHDGDAEAAEAARQYLAWEIGLVGQLDAQERSAFRIGSAG